MKRNAAGIHNAVVPAKAGTQNPRIIDGSVFSGPAFAGTTSHSPRAV